MGNDQQTQALMKRDPKTPQCTRVSDLLIPAMKIALWAARRLLKCFVIFCGDKETNGRWHWMCCVSTMQALGPRLRKEFRQFL